MGVMKSFDEWLDTTKLRGYMDENSLESAWEAGQQSQQAEVDELNREMLNKTNEAYTDGQNSMRKMIKSNEDELQKRIDEVLDYIEPSDEISHKAYRELYNILKGDSHES